MTPLRLKPSGYVHLWSDVYDRSWRTSMCGYTRLTTRLTADYPPNGRHCPTCFPKETA